MKLQLLMISGMLAAGAAFAGGPTLPDQANAKAASAQANRDSHPTADDHPTATAPALPDQASDRARTALSTIAFGQKGAEARAASQAEAHAADRAAEARAAAAARAAEARATATARAADARAAAGAGAAQVTVPTPTSHPGH
ncbi:MAG TPA: hypothetical protein VND93_27145 [Myxococcales bacterium]|nr:hypothetical protein [Myxococcales bacterium]